MLQITIHDLQVIMRQCAGELEGTLPVAQAPDQSFEELGYDSIAMLETHGRIEREYGIKLCESEVGGLNNARELVHFVNLLLQLKALSAA